MAKWDNAYQTQQDAHIVNQQLPEVVKWFTKLEHLISRVVAGQAVLVLA